MGPRWLSARTFASALLALAALAALPAYAADHREAPGAIADPAADIADVYAWHAGGRLVIALTFAGRQVPVSGQGGMYDPDLLYTVHLGRSDVYPASQTSSVKIYARFGESSAGTWGVKVDNIPGVTGSITGAVETELEKDGAMVWAGLREEPFFFDFEGLQTTLATSTVSFMSTRDSFAGENCTALVLEMDLADALAGTGDNLYIWATTGRLP